MGWTTQYGLHVYYGTSVRGLGRPPSKVSGCGKVDRLLCAKIYEGGKYLKLDARGTTD